MPRSKRVARKTTRRKTSDRRNNPIDAFWKRVIDGTKKFLESPFK
tara:strand:+ start:4662 stop:4796 length:135 start_codon:yes stop_codon:yes gene_type:complete